MTKGEQPINVISHIEKITIIKALTNPRPSKDDYHLLGRPAQVTISDCVLVTTCLAHTSTTNSDCHPHPCVHVASEINLQSMSFKDAQF